MAGDTKKKMRAELKIDPRTEMDGKVIKWLNSVDELKKKFQPFTYSEDLELDTRKWDKNKLSKALEALVRYELKRLSVQTATAFKAVGEKASPKEFNAAVKSLLREYDDIAKEIKDKCSLALEELSSDKGDNKKNLRDGKAAFAKMKQADLAKAFSGPREIVVGVFKLLSVELEKATGNDKASAAAYVTAAKKMEEADKEFNGNAKDIQSAVDYLLKVAKDMAGNGEADKELQDFGEKIKAESATLKEFLDEIGEFENSIDGAIDDVKQKSLDPKGAKKKASDFEANKKLDGYATKIKAIIDKLATDFAKVEKKLK
jgi:uncharacterized protein YukE